MVLREGNVVMKLENGNDLRMDDFEKTGFNRPILIANKEGLGMIVPNKSFTVMDVERCVGMFKKTCCARKYIHTPATEGSLWSNLWKLLFSFILWLQNSSF